jgi:hypothetical protein
VLDGVGEPEDAELAVDDRREFAGVVLGDVRIRVRRNDQDARDLAPVIADLVAALWPAPRDRAEARRRLPSPERRPRRCEPSEV